MKVPPGAPPRAKAVQGHTRWLPGCPRRQTQDAGTRYFDGHLAPALPGNTRANSRQRWSPPSPLSLGSHATRWDLHRPGRAPSLDGSRLTPCGEQGAPTEPADSVGLRFRQAASSDGHAWPAAFLVGLTHPLAPPPPFRRRSQLAPPESRSGGLYWGARRRAEGEFESWHPPPGGSRLPLGVSRGFLDQHTKGNTCALAAWASASAPPTNRQSMRARAVSMTQPKHTHANL